MKRIIFAIILGLVFPIVCLIILGITDDYLPKSLMLAKLNNEPVPGILLFPFTIPVYLAVFLKQNNIVPILFDDFLFRISSFILFNWFFYGIIIYIVLRRLKRFKKTKTFYAETPPPPNFEEKTN